MIKGGSLLPGVALASVLAGPIFILTTAAASLYLRIPQPVVVSGSEVALFFLAMFWAALVGWIIALPVNAVCAFALARLADRIRPARWPVSWALVGALIGALMVRALRIEHPESAVALGIVATSAICGWICRLKMRWIDCNRPQVRSWPPAGSQA